jgi:hypothetical protein
VQGKRKEGTKGNLPPSVAARQHLLLFTDLPLRSD